MYFITRWLFKLFKYTMVGCVTLLTVLQIQYVQDKIVLYVIKHINDNNVDTQITVSDVQVIGFEKIQLGHVSVVKNNQNVLSGTFKAKFNLYSSIIRGCIVFDNIRVDNTSVEILNIENDNSNKQFTYPLNFPIMIKNLSIVNSSIKKDINSVDELNCVMSNTFISDSQIGTVINELSLHVGELQVNNISSNIMYQNGNMTINNTNIDTNCGSITFDGFINTLDEDINCSIDESKIHVLKLYKVLNTDILIPQDILKYLTDDDLLFVKGKTSYKKGIITLNDIGFIYDNNQLNINGDISYDKVVKYNINTVLDVVNLNKYNIPIKRGNIRCCCEGEGYSGKIPNCTIKTDIGSLILTGTYDNINDITRAINAKVKLDNVSIRNYKIKNLHSKHDITIIGNDCKIKTHITNINYSGIDINNISNDTNYNNGDLTTSLNIKDNSIDIDAFVNTHGNDVSFNGKCDISDLNRLWGSGVKVNTSLSCEGKLFEGNVNVTFNKIKCLLDKTPLSFQEVTIRGSSINDVDIDVKSTLGSIKVKNLDYRYIYDDIQRLFYDIHDRFPFIISTIKHKNIKKSVGDRKTTFLINLNDLQLVKDVLGISIGSINVNGLLSATQDVVNFICDLKSDRISYDSIKVSNIVLKTNLNSRKKNFIGKFSTDIATLKTNFGTHKNIIFSFEYDIPQVKCFINAKNVCDINLSGNITNKNIHFDDNSIKILWFNIDRDNDIIIDNNTISFDGIALEYKNSSLNLGGAVNMHNILDSTLNLKVDNFALDILHPMYIPELYGVLNVGINIKNRCAVVNTLIENLCITNNRIGNAKLFITYDNQNKINYSIELGSNKNKFKLIGLYDNKNKIIDGNAIFNNFILDPFEYYTQSICDQLRGLINGQLAISGSINDPIYDGKLDYDGTVLFTHLGSIFKAKANFIGSKSKLDIPNITFSDINNHKAIYHGYITLNPFQIPYLDVVGNLEEFNIVKLKPYQNDYLSGNLVCSGTSSIKGKVTHLSFEGDVFTDKNSTIYIYTNENNDNVINEYITIVDDDEDKNNEEDDDEGEKVTMTNDTTTEKDNKYGCDLYLKAKINNNLNICFDVNNVINVDVHGIGDLSLLTNFDNMFNINGNYNILDGTCKLSISNMDSYFKVTGGKVQFNRNLEKSIFNNVVCQNVFPLKSIDNHYTEVTLTCNINDNILNPQITYDILINDINDSTKKLIDSINNNPTLKYQYFVNIILFKSLEINENIIVKYLSGKLTSNNNLLPLHNLDIDMCIDDMLIGQFNPGIVYDINKYISLRKRFSNKNLNRGFADDIFLVFGKNRDVKQYININDNDTNSVLDFGISF